VYAVRDSATPCCCVADRCVVPCLERTFGAVSEEDCQPMGFMMVTPQMHDALSAVMWRWGYYKIMRLPTMPNPSPPSSVQAACRFRLWL
jgi:hypothetical protein